MSHGSIIAVVLAWTFILGSIDSFALGTPAQTLRRAQKEKDMELRHTELSNGKVVEELDCPYGVNDLSVNLRKRWNLERMNAQYQDPDEFAGEIDTKFLGPYDPKTARVKYIPYIPIPADQFSENLVASNINTKLQKILFFDYQGVRYVRFFIHPANTEKYLDLIEKYGVVRTEFIGVLGASPRSWFVEDPKDPSLGFFQPKTSLHLEVDGSLRINPPPKVARSALVNDLLAAIPQAIKDQYGFDFLPEVGQFMPKGKAAALLVRQFPEEFVRFDASLVAGFNVSSAKPGQTPFIAKLVGDSENKFKAAAEWMEPILRVAAYLMFEEGLVGELHEQNMYLKLGPDGKIKKVYIKDLDGFRVDLELRLRKGKSLAGLRRVFKPFIYSKFSQASGWTGDASFHQTAYYSYIKRTFGYSFCVVLKCSDKEKARLYEEMDFVMGKAASEITGLPVNPRTMMTNDTEGFEGLKFLAQRVHENLEESLNVSQLPAENRSVSYQTFLRQKFVELRLKKRATAARGDLTGKQTYFILHPDVIEAREIDPENGHETSIGIAALLPENPDDAKSFSKLADRELRKARIELEDGDRAHIRPTLRSCTDVFSVP